MKNLLQKIIGILCIACLCSIISCTKSKDKADEEKIITMFQIKIEIKDALDAYAAQYSAEHPGITVKIETLGGGEDYSGVLKAKVQAKQMPDIFVIEGRGSYKLWKSYLADLSDQSWVADTDLAMKVDGKVVGFPVSIEGYGLAYNADILQKAGVDPAALTTRTAYEKAFALIDSKKKELGLDAVVSMAASLRGGMWWVAAHHNFACYLGGGLPQNDSSIVDKLVQEGTLDDARFEQYAKYVQLLFKYADKNILLNGGYDNQIASFAQQKTAFLHQGNWVDPNLKQLNANFKMGYAPHAFLDTEDRGLYLFAPSFYCVNVKSPHVEEAKKFLTSIAATAQGHEYMVKKAGMIPAFKSVTLLPEGQLSRALVEANTRGGNHGVFFGMMPDGTGQNLFGPIYDLFAQQPDNMSRFITDMKNAASDLPILAQCF